MKPNEHIKLPDDELIAHIKEHLMAHEEDYVPGAWERFNSEKPAKKRGTFFWLGSMSSAAALILIGFAIFFVNNKKVGIKQPVLTKVKDAGQIVKPSGSSATIQDVTANPVLAIDRLESKPVVGQLNSISDPKFEQPKTKLDALIPMEKVGGVDLSIPTNNVNIGENQKLAVVLNPLDQITAKPLLETAQETIIRTVPGVVKKQSLTEFLAEESRNGNANEIKYAQKQTGQHLPGEKWEMGVMVAPSFGNSKKLNMGYGVSMAYALNKNVSINSGISYNEMGASKNISSNSNTLDAPNTMTGLPGNSKRLKSVDASLRGIDIPLEIRYRLSKSLYANVGVSAFAVLNQRQKNTFLESQVQNSQLDPATASLKVTVYSTTVTEEKGTENLNSDPYLGFYNFSLGYKQQISRGKSVSLEPFVKLPIKEFTQENLYLIGTGLRLKFDF